MTPEEALEYGLIDRILASREEAAAARLARPTVR
jgi:ATP-dependent protease ClpP protease subunit